MAVPKPNYTQVPNALLDSIAIFSGAEWKILSAMCRQTFGFHRANIQMSISWFETLTGLSNRAVIDSVQSLLDRGSIVREKAGQSFSYNVALTANFAELEETTCEKSSQVTCEKSSQVEAETYEKSSHKERKPKERAIKKRVSASPPAIPAIPDPLNTPAFVTAWEEWRQHREEIKHPLTPLSITKQFKKLTEWGEVRAIAAIDHSIRKGWRDCFEPKEEPPTYNANGCPTNRPLSIMDKKTIIAAKEVQAKELKDRFCSEVSTGDMWSDKVKRKEWFGLRNEIRDLNNQIARSA